MVNNEYSLIDWYSTSLQIARLSPEMLMIPGRVLLTKYLLNGGGEEEGGGDQGGGQHQEGHGATVRASRNGA